MQLLNTGLVLNIATQLCLLHENMLPCFITGDLRALSDLLPFACWSCIDLGAIGIKACDNKIQHECKESYICGCACMSMAVARPMMQCCVGSYTVLILRGAGEGQCQSREHDIDGVSGSTHQCMYVEFLLIGSKDYYVFCM